MNPTRALPIAALLAACGPKSAPPTSEPLRGSAPVELPVFDSTNEAEMEWVADTFDADLDGDGAAETYEFTCGTGVAIEVTSGDQKVSSPTDVVELMGCSGAVVTMGPTQPRRALLVAAQDHDEVGPPSHAVFMRDEAGLHVAWSGDGELTWYADGHWTAITTDCYDRGELVTTTWTMYWTGSEVHEGSRKESEPIDPSACIEP